MPSFRIQILAGWGPGELADGFPTSIAMTLYAFQHASRRVRRTELVTSSREPQMGAHTRATQCSMRISCPNGPRRTISCTPVKDRLLCAFRLGDSATRWSTTMHPCYELYAYMYNNSIAISYGYGFMQETLPMFGWHVLTCQDAYPGCFEVRGPSP